MRFRHQQRYDAPPAEVHAMLAERAFRDKVCRAQQAHTATVSIERDGPGMSVVVDQARPSDGIPAFARKFVGDEIRIVQREDWSGPTHAALEVRIPGKPGELDGTVTLTGDGSGTVHSIDGELKVAIPMFGGKLEALISGLLAEALDVEQTVGRAWLRGER